MKIIVLCGGKGMRLKPITDNIPKPMVDLNGKPVLEHILQMFKQHGHNDFILAIGYKGEVIKDYFKDKPEYNIEYSDAGDVSMLERIKFASQGLKDVFMVVYGDTIANVNINLLCETHITREAWLTITTYPMQSPFGIVKSNKKHNIIDFEEKPFLDQWINIGFMVFDPIIFVPPFLPIESDLVKLFKGLIGSGNFYEHRHKGKHITINTLKEMKKAENDIKYFYTVDGGINK